MGERAVNRWIGKSAEDVLAESYYEIRDPVYNAVGYLNVLNSSNQLSTEQIQQFIHMALSYALRAQDIVDSVYEYMNEKRKDR